jgi:hypothetical protein
MGACYEFATSLADDDITSLNGLTTGTLNA